MSAGVSCKCIANLESNADKAVFRQKQWRVIKRNYNNSAFNGYQRTFSDYSTVTCMACGAVWRTKAAYVEDLK